MSELTVVDYATLWTTFLATAGSVAGLWVYFRKGPVLALKIIPPTRNRKNKSYYLRGRNAPVSAHTHG